MCFYVVKLFEVNENECIQDEYKKDSGYISKDKLVPLTVFFLLLYCSPNAYEEGKSKRYTKVNDYFYC